MQASQRVEQKSIVSPKLDGVFARATADGIFSKGGKRITGQEKLERRLKLHFKLRPGSELRGELYRHGAPFEKTLSDYKAKKALPYHVFPGQKRPLPVLGVKRVKGKKVADQSAADRHYQKALRAGYEGQVARAPDGSLTKRKPRADQEYTVRAVARRKKHGVLDVSDGDASFRVQAPKNVATQANVGKLVTVSNAGKWASGAPRDPVYKAVRDYDLASGQALCYLARKVKLSKPARGDVKKFKVYVRDPKTGRIVKVNFGHGGTSAKRRGEKTMRIRRSNAAARRSFRARHKCATPGPRTKAKYWSCKKW